MKRKLSFGSVFPIIAWSVVMLLAIMGVIWLCLLSQICGIDERQTLTALAAIAALNFMDHKVRDVLAQQAAYAKGAIWKNR